MFAQKVALFNINSEPYYAVVIENEDFYDTQKNLFDLVWKAYHIPAIQKNKV